MSENSQGIKVLVVDDNLVNQELIGDFFESVGFQADFARDGERALQCLRMEEYDICLMDITMPIMDGLTAVKIIRKEISSEIPIIVVSALDKMVEREKGEYSEVTDWILKPIDLDELKEKILLHVKKG